MAQTGEISGLSNADLLSLGEKLFGTDSPHLARDVAADAQALCRLARNDEARPVGRRTQIQPLSSRRAKFKTVT